MSRLDYLPSSPTLFNSGTRHPQMSSCYLLDSPLDELDSIYDRYHQVARLSKHAGGIGLSYSRIRSRGSLIRGTNGHSNGIVPFLKTLDASVAAVNQGGRRKGAAAVYLETWHSDIEEFLELRDNTGEDAAPYAQPEPRALDPGRVHAPGRTPTRDWSLFSPADVPELVDLWGDEFDAAYRKAEADGLARKTIPARDLYGRMMRTLAQTGNGWMTFKDAANRTANQTAEPGHVVHSSNLCTEILEVTDDGETAVCNLGSVNLGAFVDRRRRHRLGAAGRDRPHRRHLPRPRRRHQLLPDRAGGPLQRQVAPGRPGRDGPRRTSSSSCALPFDSPEAQGALHAHRRAHHARRVRGLRRPRRAQRPAAGLGEDPYGPGRAAPRPLRRRARTGRSAGRPCASASPTTGMRNSLLLAIAPTATIASIAGVYECIEPQVSNLFKRETLSGEFLQVNSYLVEELKELGVWDAQTREALRESNGSVQGFAWIPADVRALYRTAWEIPQRGLIDMAAARTPFLDQSQSLNLFLETPTIGKLSSMYAYAWKSGLKTTYYLRSRPATRIARAAQAATARQPPSPSSRPPTPTPSPAPWKTPSPARPASNAPATRTCSTRASS